MADRHVEVGIVGAGPAGLLLSHLLHLAGISSIVLEARSRAHIESRIRAGVLEQNTVDALREAGVGARMDREGLLHHGTILKLGGEARRIDFADLTGKAVMVYGQHEVVKDLVAARLAAGGEIVFEAEDVRIAGIESDRPSLSWTREGAGGSRVAFLRPSSADGVLVELAERGDDGGHGGADPAGESRDD